MATRKRGRPIVSKPRPRINAVIDDRNRRFAERAARDNGVTLSEVVNAALGYMRRSFSNREAALNRTLHGANDG